MRQQIGGGVVDSDSPFQVGGIPASATQGDRAYAQFPGRLDVVGRIAQHHDFLGGEADLPQRAADYVGVGFGVLGVGGGGLLLDKALYARYPEQGLEHILLGGGSDHQFQA